MWHFFAFFGGLIAMGAVGALLLRRKPQVTDAGAHSRQLEELSRLTGEIAHEIKNPLSTIKINLQLASEELEDARKEGLSPQAENRLGRAQRKIAVTRKEAERIEQILDGFLRYADRSELELANIDINELVGDMLDFYGPQAYSHSLTMRQCLSAEPLVCRVDADMLKQALLNLLLNAQQAMSAGGELMIRTNKDGADAVVAVSDTGVGIPADKLGHIFDAYHSSRPQGSGLGLPTVKRIIDRHGGKITVDSEPGKGTQFTIRLPMAVE
jgi:signal transduction histidine kinase